MSVRVPFDSVMVGAEIPELSKVVLPTDVLAYADVSDDRNPLHLDDAFAKEAGFAGQIAHGMFTLAHLTTCLTDWLGDPAGLDSIRVLFRAPVFMGDTVVAGGTIKEVDAGTKRAVLDIWVRVDRVDRDGQEKPELAIRRSRAEVTLA